MKITSRRPITLSRSREPCYPLRMADNTDDTHIAFGKKYYTKKLYVWLEIGKGRLDAKGIFHGKLDRTIIGGFSGYICFVPIGKGPPHVEPERPGDEHGDDEEF